VIKPVYTIKVLLKENVVKVIPFTRSKFGQSFYPKVPFGRKFKDKQNGLSIGVEEI
jgi:hypothetical protein